MRVAIDLSSAVYGGAITYARELFPHLSEYVDISAVLARPTAIDLLPQMPYVTCEGRLGARSARWQAAVEDCDVVYAPTEVSFRSYDIPLVLAIRNASLAPTLFPEMGMRKRTRFVVQREFARRSAKWATRHIAVSKFAAGLATNLRVPSKRVRVVYHGGPPIVRAVKSGPARTFLFVSALNRHKNVDRMIAAFEGLPGNWDLQIVGPTVEEKFRQALEDLSRTLGLEDRIHFRGPLSGDALGQAYLNADCFLWPPYLETFGHPLIEAYASGLPIIAARAASNEEIAGDAAVYFDPLDVKALHGRLRAAVSGRLRTGPLPRDYKWSQCAASTADVLHEASRSGVAGASDVRRRRR